MYKDRRRELQGKGKRRRDRGEETKERDIGGYIGGETETEDGG
jgi:hypothetical protein